MNTIQFESAVLLAIHLGTPKTYRRSRPEDAASLARCEFLSPDWREKLARAENDR